MKHLSVFEKREIVRISQDHTNTELAVKFGVCVQTIKRLFGRLKKAEISLPARKRGRRKGRVYPIKQIKTKQKPP